MKQKIINPDKDFQHVAEEKPCTDAVSHSAEEINAFNIYWLDYSYPFVPMNDFTLAFDELRKIIKKWFLHKRDRTNHS